MIYGNLKILVGVLEKIVLDKSLKIMYNICNYDSRRLTKR